MVLIQNIEDCKELVDNRKSSLSNCFFMPAQMKELVEKKKLYHYDIGDNFLILHREPSFYRVYYFIKNPEQISKVTLALPAVIEFPFRENLTEEQKKQIGLIEKMGFQLERESIRMSMKTDDFDYNKKIIEFPDLKIDYARVEDVQVIYRLLDKTFDELFAFLLSEEELIERVKKHSILAAYLRNELVGVYNYEVNGKIAIGSQLAVATVGSGIGWLLMNKFHVLYKDEVKVFRLWADLHNRSAIQMYKKTGYRFDGSRANEYVYRP